MAKTVEIRVTAKAQNAILARLVSEYGSIKAVARELGVSGSTVGAWLNFKWKPGHRAIYSEKVKNALLKLEQLTGRSMKEIFPLTKEEMAILARPRVSEHVVETERLTYAVEQEYMNYTPTDPAEVAEKQERIQEVLKTLPFREREIIKLRFGLNGEYPHTLEEVGHIFKINRERVRQIEAKAIRRLQQPSRSQELVDL